MVKCPNCGRENQDDAKICVYCGQMVDVARYGSTRVIPDTDYEEGTPKWGTARFSSRTHLVITIVGSEKQFIFDADDVEELIIGRKDPETGMLPAVDLLNHGGLEKGVSRQHAAIVRLEGSLQIKDNGSPNGTFLNGQKLVPHQPRVLRDGDDIRLGHLTLRINFVKDDRSLP